MEFPSGESYQVMCRRRYGFFQNIRILACAVWVLNGNGNTYREMRTACEDSACIGERGFRAGMVAVCRFVDAVKDGVLLRHRDL